MKLKSCALTADEQNGGRESTSRADPCLTTLPSTISGRNYFALRVAPKVVADLMLRSAIYLLVLNSAASAEQFAFRGIPLGTSLADFRKLPYPDASVAPKARPICTGDADMAKAKYNAVSLGDDAQRVGVVACRYYVPSSALNVPGAQYLPAFSEIAPDLANIGGYTTTFYFSPSTLPADIARRLYIVTVTPHSDRVQTIIDAMKAKYGPPSSEAFPTIKNRMGAEFADIVANWVADGSTILIRKYGERIGQGAVTYGVDAIVDATNRLYGKVAAENAKKL